MSHDDCFRRSVIELRITQWHGRVEVRYQGKSTQYLNDFSSLPTSADEKADIIIGDDRMTDQKHTRVG